MRFLTFILLITKFFLLFPQKNTPTRILFIFDVSRSMTGKFQDDTKMNKAKELFYKLIDSLALNKNNQFALRAFGHTVKYPPGDCKDSRLLVPFSKTDNTKEIKNYIKSFQPTGITPIEHSLTRSANDFPDNKITNVIILITDGIEECGGDPCKAKAYLASKGIELKPFIIGIGLTPEQIKSYDCVGKFIDSETPNIIQDINQTIHEFKNLKTTFQVNLLNSNHLPEETNVNFTLWDSTMSQYSHNYIHTLNNLGNPDTLQLPVRRTKVQAHTIPPTFSPYTEIVPGKHTVIPVSVPQGSLQIKRPDGLYNQNDQLKFIVRHRAGKNTLHVQPVNTTEKYIIGSYDLEILTLPRIYMYDVKIEEKKLNLITIPNDGQLIVKTLEAGDGCIMQQTENGLEWVVNLTNKNYQEFYLQPGKYVLAWRSKKLKSSIYTIEKKFTIQSDKSVTMELYKQ